MGLRQQWILFGAYAIWMAMTLGVVGLPRPQTVPSWDQFFARVPTNNQMNMMMGQQQNVFPNVGQQVSNSNPTISDSDVLNLFGVGSTTPMPLSTTTSTQYRDCLQSCPNTSEYNPVCGNDDQTYSNSGQLRCAQFCGRSVSMLRVGTCMPL